MPSPSRIANMIRSDLEAARAAWLQDAPPQDRKAREESRFLCYTDSVGRFADFHALRHSCGSLLAATGAHPKVAQAIMRHSDINLTLSRYSHVYAGQEAGAVAALPDLDEAPVRQSAKATGTDSATAQAVQAAQDAPGCPRTGDHPMADRISDRAQGRAKRRRRG
jgi:hypothetical protein